MARILIVDDYEGVREMVAVFLKKVGHDVKEAASGKEALVIVKNQSFDFVLTDLEMPPGMNGGELTREIKKGDSAERPKN